MRSESAGDALAKALDDWASAWSAVRAASHGSPEWEEARVLADEAQWRFRGALTERKRELSGVSRAILATVDKLEAMEARRAQLDPTSPDVAALSGEISEAAERLLALARDEQRAGQPM